MEQLANKGNGNYFYIDSFQEGRKVFEKDLFATMEIVAKDVKLQVEFNAEHVLEYRLVGYDNRALQNQDFANDKIDAGEIGAGHTVTAIYEVVLAGSELADTVVSKLRYGANKQMQKQESAPQVARHSRELAFVKVRFKEPHSSTSKLLEYPVMTRDVQKSFSQGSTDFKFAAAVAYFAQVLRKSQFAGDIDITAILKVAKQGAGEDSDGLRREFVELVKNVKFMKRQERTGGPSHQP
jgi:Ca-activated chloride channel family protein